MPTEQPRGRRPACRSPVYWALLGLLIEHPSYGYKLLTRYEREFGELLPLSSCSHVYTALNALEDRELIEVVAAQPQLHSCRRQHKPSYRATPAGEAGYRDWVSAHVSEDRRHWRVFMRELAVFMRSPEVALEILERCEHAYREEKAALGSAATSSRTCENGAGMAARLAHAECNLTIEGRLRWVSYARDEFGGLPGGPRR